MDIENFMDKVISIVIVIFSVIMVTACSANEESADILLNQLKKDQIVPQNIELVDVATSTNTVLFLTKTNYYIYQDSDKEMIAIEYEKDISKNDYDYTITIYKDVYMDADVEYIEDTNGYDSWVSYRKDDRITSTNKYRMGKTIKYFVYEKKSLFSKKYAIKEESEV